MKAETFTGREWDTIAAADPVRWRALMGEIRTQRLRASRAIALLRKVVPRAGRSFSDLDPRVPSGDGLWRDILRFLGRDKP